MTVAEFIHQTMVAAARARVATLQRIQAGEGVIELQQAALARVEAREYKVAGLEALATVVTTGAPVPRTGRGGKKYLVIPTEAGEVLFFPQAKHGPYITKAEAK